MGVIRVYSIIKDGKVIATECWDEYAVTFENFKENRKDKYGDNIEFRFKYCYT